MKKMKKQEGDVNIKGKFAAGRDINIGKYSNFRWLIGSLKETIRG